MREISSKEYALEVSDAIEDVLFDGLWEVYEVLSKRYGFGKQTWREKKGGFYNAYYDGAAAEMRDIAIRLFEECGMDVRPDEREY